jgi:hypothetical protein
VDERDATGVLIAGTLWERGRKETEQGWRRPARMCAHQRDIGSEMANDGVSLKSIAGRTHSCAASSGPACTARSCPAPMIARKWASALNRAAMSSDLLGLQ